MNIRHVLCDPYLVSFPFYTIPICLFLKIHRIFYLLVGMKLSAHTNNVTPMTHECFPWQQPTIISLRKFSLKSLLHFSNLPTMVHMEMKLCAYVFHCFHNNPQQKMPSGTFPYNYFFTSQTSKPCNAWS